jgi:uncharacterized protein (DUF58 family)
MAAQDGISLLDPAALARLGNLELLAKAVVEGFVLGLHRSPYRGFSVEFAEYRPYVPGDDPKRIDWKAYGKTDRHYLKLYEEETNLACHLVLDASASMGFGSGGTTKLQYAARMAACLAYFMMGQRDAAGLLVFDQDVRTFLPARLRRSHLQRVLGELAACEPGGETALNEPLHRAAQAIRRRGMVVLISDLLGELAPLAPALQHLRHAGHEVIVFQVLDRQELDFPFDGPTEFTDLETGERITTAARSARAAYLEGMAAHQEAIASLLSGLGIDHAVFDTTMPLDRALAEWLYRRGRSG